MWTISSRLHSAEPHRGGQQPPFWAKTTRDGLPGISVLEHMLNVGCVAQCLADTTPGILARFGLQARLVGALAALHDLGKISPGFQAKSQVWLEAQGLSDIARRYRWEATTEGNHARVTQAAVQDLLPELMTIEPKTARCLAALLGAHHGRIQAAPTRPFRPEQSGPAISESNSRIEWDQARMMAGKAVMDAFQRPHCDMEMSYDSPALWWLAGLTSVADWIGSDERHFPPEGGMEEDARQPRARETVEEIGFRTPRIVSGLGFAELFGPSAGSTPYDMQIRAHEFIKGPGVYVIEAPMGMGKTEAALWVAYDLLAAGKARGIYFALPTQATSNRIHLRMDEFLRRITPDAGTVRLIHANSWLMDETSQKPTLSTASTTGGRSEDARAGEDWFASAKRALLAPFGVGTVDQALLAVVAAKHFFVRQFALAGKVIILDEVHSYDLYTGTLIDRLVEVLEGLGCTVIILSATLTGRRRAQLVPLDLDSGDPRTLPYPMISGCPEMCEASSIATDAPAKRTVQVSFQSVDAALARAVKMALDGQVVLWICDTVGSAQEQFDRVTSAAGSRFPVGLLHSRFPFWRREELEGEWMTRLGKDGATRCGCILVSTQIVEQSVDLDADFLVTELAPTDMLFQRMGRLWRHERPGRPGDPEMVILEEPQTLDALRSLDGKAIVLALGTKAYVYSPYVLLRSLEVWRSATTVSIPDQIRERIEATYEERCEGEEPDAWQKLFIEMYGKKTVYQQLALQSSNIWTVALEDEEGVQTRLSELPTVQLILCRNIEARRCVFLNGDSETMGNDQHQLNVSRAIQKNLVKVPKHIFKAVRPCAAFDQYLYGLQTLGVVSDERVRVDGLKDGVQIRWSTEGGLRIENDSKRSQE